MKKRGLILIFIAVVIPLLWTVPLANQHNTAAIYSQYAGIVSLILMGITQLIATRAKGIESIFGSLDRAYILHKWLGLGALVTAFLHSEIDAEAGNIVLVRSLSDLAEEIGEVGYSGLSILILMSFMTFIPYKYWKWSHRFIGIFFSLAAFHYLYIEKPYAVFDLPGLYTTAFCVMGIVSYLYLLIPRMMGHNSTAYTVTNVIQHKSITEIEMRPQQKGIKHRAGQFAFIDFEQNGLRESHPFTISSPPRPDGSLRFMVKGLGDYTNKLGTTLQVGSTARVSKAFGHFRLKNSNRPQVWVGGGIGITPFIAWAESLPTDWATSTHLYYCVSTASEAVYVERLKETAVRVPNFTFTLVTSKTGKRLTAEQIMADLEGDIRQTDLYFCGPAPMRDALKAGLVKQGLRPSRFHYEAFEMRKGLDMMGWLRQGWYWLPTMSKRVTVAK